jgi:alkyl sulfatase BDS1-like metallo-beta-lactamase superfamily hydrolase
VDLAGGRSHVLAAVELAVTKEGPQWAAELAAMLATLDPANTAARQLRAAALCTLGYPELNTSWRNWYLLGAKELEGEIDLKTIAPVARRLLYLPDLSSTALLDGLCRCVNPEVAGGQRLGMRIDLAETHEQLDLRLRNSVLDVSENEASPESRL